jgi:retron-type reverse transcriptase
MSNEATYRKVFFRCFAKRRLEGIFIDRISSKNNAGIDGIHPHDINEDESFKIIRRKVSAGTYHFTPYAEIQSPKGRGKLPRIIALPTVRDQIVLSALKNYLHDIFSDAVNRKLPNSYIFDLNKDIQKVKTSGRKYGFMHTDISGFYDNIDREKLMNFLRVRINVPEALKLIYRAIANPIVPRDSRRNQQIHYYTSKGVPQGLAISNILAGIYMTKVDQSMKSLSDYYIRYVDDILILCPLREIPRVKEQLSFEVSKLGLSFNQEKTKIGKLDLDDESFDFLGYKLKSNYISVRDSSVHRKISKLAGKMSSADHKIDEFVNLHKEVTKKVYRKVLVEDINEQITGAINDEKRYGWLFYFSQINDMALLHRLDRVVKKLCERCQTLSRRDIGAIKSFVVAFREIHKHDSPYIPSYSNWSIKQKRKFLSERGLLKGKKRNEEEINILFKITIHKRLLDQERDLKNMS